LTVIAIEPNREIAGQLQVLLLVFAHRHQVGLIEQNVRRHQDRIIEQPDADVFLLFARLVLELRHALELGHARHPVKQPGQFRVGRNIRLHKNRRHVGIDADGDIDARQFTCLGRQDFRILREGDGVQVHDAEKTLVIVLQRDPVAQRAQVISQMNVTRGLGATKDSFRHD
jgi:hypothetical protein